MAVSEKPFRISRLVAALLVFLLAAEGAARLVVWSYAGEGFRSLSLYRWSPYGLVRNNPYLTSPSFRINANGFRATRDYAREKAPGTIRVILLGGSVLYSGIGGKAYLTQYGRVSSDETIAPFLEARIKADPAFIGREIEVINAAVNFNRIVEVSAAYLEEYLHWDPDVVVVFGAVNNFSEVRLEGGMARGETSLQRGHPWRAEFERLVNDRSLSAGLERLWRSGAEHSAALALASKAFSGAADRLVALAGRLTPPAKADPIPLESKEETEAYFRLFTIYADAMTAAARRSGQEIAFVWEPMLSDLAGIKPLSAEEATIQSVVARQPEEIAQYDRARRLFNDYFADQGTPYLDPTAAMMSHDETVFIDYGHYTPGGNAFIAGLLFETLRPRLLEIAKP